MAHILILGGGAAGLAAALAAAQAAPAACVTVLERNPKVGKKLLATGNGRCNLDNTAIAPEKYFTADPAALRPLLAAVDAAAPLAWFEQLGLYTRTDEAGRVYPYSNQAADVLALLELHLQRHTVQLRTGCTVSTLRQSKGGYAVQFTTAEGGTENLRADAAVRHGRLRHPLCRRLRRADAPPLPLPDRPAMRKAEQEPCRHPRQSRRPPAGR